MCNHWGSKPACLLTVVLLAAACSDDGPSESLDLAERPTDQPAPESEQEAPESAQGATQRATPATTGRGLDLDLGRWAGDERSRPLQRYLAAVGQTVRSKVTSPLFFDSTSAQQMDDRRALAARAKDQGATVADTTLAYLVGLEDRGAAAVAEVCLWAPSVTFVDERTGEPLRPTPQQWTPRSVTMTFVQQQWWVVDEARGRFACDEEAP
ncbi:MAG: hypothetical protein M3419_04620 [Actinomycetota bacterium]|nr:hypothetical protein [Actinomycetota bacterium]